MSVLQRLQEKIEVWKRDHEALKAENTRLRDQLENASRSDEKYRSQIAALKAEIEEKDIEMEAIITKVESLWE